jgi:hypothetical protein
MIAIMSVMAGATSTGFRTAAGRTPLAALLGLAALGVATIVRLLHLDALGFPVCFFKATTGLPCLTCGGTRALVHLARLDVLGALAMNPLVAVSLLALVPWAIADAVLALRGRSLVLEIGPAVRQALMWSAFPLLIANWAYLIAVGR